MRAPPQPKPIVCQRMRCDKMAGVFLFKLSNGLEVEAAIYWFAEGYQDGDWWKFFKSQSWFGEKEQAFVRKGLRNSLPQPRVAR